MRRFLGAFFLPRKAQATETRITADLSRREREEKALPKGIHIISVDKKIITPRTRLPKSHFSLVSFAIVNDAMAHDRYRANDPIISNFDVGSVRRKQMALIISKRTMEIRKNMIVKRKPFKISLGKDREEYRLISSIK